MFRPAPMRQVDIFVDEDDVFAVTVALGHLGVLHLAELEDAGEWAREGGGRWSKLDDRYETLERELEDLLDTLEISRQEGPPPDEMKPEEDARRIEEEIDGIRKHVQDWEARRDSVEKRIEHLRLLREEAMAVAPLDVSVEKLRGFEHLHLVVGSLPRENLERLQLVLLHIPFVIVSVYEHGGRVLVFAASAQTDAAVLDRALASALFEPLELPEDRDWLGEGDTYETLARQLDEILDTLQTSREDRVRPDQAELARETPGEEEPEGIRIEDVQGAVQEWERRMGATGETESIAPLELSLEKLRRLEHVRAVVGTLPKGNLERLQVEPFGIPFVIVPLSETDDRVFVFAASAEADGAVLQRALASALFEPVELARGATRARESLVSQEERRLERAREQREALDQEREGMAQAYRDSLLRMWRQTRYNASVTGTISQFERHEGTYLIAGWVPKRELDELVATVERVAQGGADVEVLEARAERKTPILLQNPSFLKPFQNIVSVFGFPAYNDIDPTPIVALTFVLMFGMMFGDVGHGLLLALLGVWLSRREGYASLGRVITVAGVSGAAFGLLYGSLFGREDILPHLWLRPLEDLTTIFVVSVVAGVALLNIGFVLHLVTALRSGDWGELFFSKNGLAGIGLYWALLGGGIALVRGASFPLTLWGLAMVVPAIPLFLREPLERLISGARPLVDGGWAMYAVRAFFELLETIIGYFTNSISFVRLGAFAVAHGALTQVIFIIADMVGSVGRWPIIILGTFVVVGFEGLVVAIQALRLEYYEFFDKFFHGTGRPFQPFRLASEGGVGVPGEV